MDPLILIARQPIVPEGARAESRIVIPFGEPDFWLCHPLVPNYGRWLLHLTEGRVEAATLPYDQAVSVLARHAASPPIAGPRPRRWRSGLPRPRPA